MKITQRCSCGATFEIDGPEIPAGYRATEWLDAHAGCRIPAAAQGSADPWASRTPEEWHAMRTVADSVDRSERSAGAEPKPAPLMCQIGNATRCYDWPHCYCGRVFQQQSPALPEGGK